MATPALVVRFGISAAVGLFAAFGVGALAAPVDQARSGTQQGPVAATRAPAATSLASLLPGGGSARPSSAPGATDTSPVPASTPGPVASFQLSGDDGSPVAFDVVPPPDPPRPVKPLPPSGTIQLTSYTAWKDTGGDQSVVRPPWWNHDLPRVQPITQFDGGPFQNANCTLAAGSMLARLIFGVVTTGSQLRQLQDDREGGTSLYDLNTAIGRGWGVGFTVGALTPLQFRALLYGGAGAVLAGFYAQIPLDLRLQKNFTGGHAIYIDGFRPPGPDGPAAYYVIDPIGRPWQGYVGSWWPADLVEAFATSLGGGFMDAAWGFAGGVVPTRHPVLPADAYPGRGPTVTPGPGATPTPSPTLPAGADPMPTDGSGVPPAPDVDPGTTSPPEGEPPTGGGVATGGEVTADPGYCAMIPPPPLCPTGILGTVNGTPPGPGGSGVTGTTGPPGGIGGTGPPGGSTGSGPSPPVTTGPAGGTGTGTTVPTWLRPELIWATLIATGTYQLVYEVSPQSSLDVWYWITSASGGAISHVPGELATLQGREVVVATVTVNPGASYSFVASGSVRDIKALSEVSTIAAGL